MRRVRAALAAIALCATAGLTGAVVSAPAASAAPCTQGGGVTVVVDFGALGGGVQTGCATGDPGTGLAALNGAGFSYSFVPDQPGFVCRINGLPDPCPGVPPLNKYWSYWHGQAGGGWSYSQKGASTYDPAPGSIEGWAFGAGKAPSIAPPAPQPAPAKTTSNPDPGGAGPGGGDSNGSEPGGAGPGAGTGTTGAAPSDTASASGSASAAATPSGSGTVPASTAPGNGGGDGVDAATDRRAAASGLGSLSWVLAAVALAALVLGAWWQVRRRAARAAGTVELDALGAAGAPNSHAMRSDAMGLGAGTAGAAGAGAADKSNAAEAVDSADGSNGSDSPDAPEAPGDTAPNTDRK